MKINRPFAFTLLALVICFQWATAQKRQPNEDIVKAHKVGFITTQLALTADEAAQFWPVYNAFEDQMGNLRAKRRSSLKVDFESLSEKELKQLMIKRFDLESEELEIKKTYHNKFLEVLPTQKVAQLYHAEHEFRKELVRRLQHDRREKPEFRR